MLSRRTKTGFHFAWRTLLGLALISVSLGLSLNVAPQSSPREISFPIAISWHRQTGIKQYRLQVAGDERFRDVYIDTLVSGEQYTVKDLSPGYYYWRLSPAGANAGASLPVKFFVSGGLVQPGNRLARPAGMRAPANAQVSPANVSATRQRKRL
jgi:hypothetical protein